MERRLLPPAAVLLGIVAVLVAAAAGLIVHRALTRADDSRPLLARENAHRANNLGVGLLEQFEYGSAADAFREALALEPALGMARANLALALFHLGELQAAAGEARTALGRLPDAAEVHFLLGLIAKAESQVEEATAAFERVLEIDGDDVGTLIALGQLALQRNDFADAITRLGRARDREPYSLTATYNLAMALRRADRPAESQQVLAEFQTLREGGYGTALGPGYFEQGRYSGAMVATGLEPDLVDRTTPDVAFVPWPDPFRLANGRADRPVVWPSRAGDYSVRRALVGALEGSIAAFELDGTRALATTGPDGLRLWRLESGSFVEVTAHAGLVPDGPPRAALAVVAGDYDNDGRTDLLVLFDGAIVLYRNEGGGRFTDVSVAAGIPEYPHLAIAAAFADVDHDGDLDVTIGGFVSPAPFAHVAANPMAAAADLPGAPTLLLRNNGNGTFTDITTEAGLDGLSHVVAIVPTDFDNRRDVDLLVVRAAGPVVLLRNLRDGSFVDVAAEAGLSLAGLTSVAAGDVNKNGFVDFYFGRRDRPGVWAMSDGRSGFVLADAPASTSGTTAAQMVDYDNDGLLDLLIFTMDGPRILRNVGVDWIEVTHRAFAAWPRDDLRPAWRSFALADFDADGALDLALPMATGTPALWRNDGASRHGSLQTSLVAQVSNRSAVGTKVEMRSGSLVQRAETYAATPAPAPADLIFGLGGRDAADLVRVLWPAGILQAELADRSEAAGPVPGPVAEREAHSDRHRFQPTRSVVVVITELDRKPSSCPYLYAWNGERFAFVTDFLGGGELGYWIAPGVRNQPDPDEYVRLRSDQLQPRDGFFELRVTNELEETLFLDHVGLIAVDHPEDVLVYPEEGMLGQPRTGLRPIAVRSARPPARALDQAGLDVLSLVTEIDRRAPHFQLHPLRGYAEQHSLTLTLPADGLEATVLLLTGWTDYAFSSDNVAAHQGGLALQPPALQVRDPSGRWRTVLTEIGIPVGRPQTVVVDLGMLPTDASEIRITTNMRIYWDQALFAGPAGDAPLRKTMLQPVRAELRWRGFSAEVSPDGRPPYVYDYHRVSPASPWKHVPGRYTREGDVRELLARVDNLFVISRPGDEVALSFNAGALPLLPAGWSRTFLLHAEGFSKEMDLNSATPDVLGPLPFRQMPGYPYAGTDRRPMTADSLTRLERYNTREVRTLMPSLQAGFLQALAERLGYTPTAADTRR
jgi:tetratricopeptide (TPR) repeat protein